MSSTVHRPGLAVLGSIGAPLLLVAAYLFASRELWPALDRAVADWAAIAGSLLVGCVFLIRLPGTLSSRVALALSYFVLGTVFLFFFMLGFVCVVFNDCL